MSTMSWQTRNVEAMISQQHADITNNAYADQRRPRKILFFKNGDRYFKGKKLYITPHRYLTFNDLMGDLTKSISLPYGVRRIYTPVGGTRITDTEDLQDGRTYVCASFERFKKIKYGQAYYPDWQTGKRLENDNYFVARSGGALGGGLGPGLGGVGLGGGLGTGNAPVGGGAPLTFSYPMNGKYARAYHGYKPGTFGMGHTGPGSFGYSNGKIGVGPLETKTLGILHGENSPIKPKVIKIVKTGDRPRKTVSLLLNKRSVQSYEQLVLDISEALGLPKYKNNRIRRLFNLQGKEIRGVADFFRDNGDVFIASPGKHTVLSNDDLADIIEELYPNSPYAQRLPKKKKRSKEDKLAGKNDSGLGDEDEKKEQERAKKKKEYALKLDKERDKAAQMERDKASQWEKGRAAKEDRERKELEKQKRNKDAEERQKRETEEEAKRREDGAKWKELEQKQKSLELAEKERALKRKEDEINRKAEEERNRKEGEKALELARKEEELRAKEEELKKRSEQDRLKKLDENEKEKEKEAEKKKREREEEERRKREEEEEEKRQKQKDKEEELKRKEEELKRKEDELRELEKKKRRQREEEEEEERKNDDNDDRNNPNPYAAPHRDVVTTDDILMKYKLGKTIGDGNFAIVKQATLIKTDDEFAMKIIDKAKMRGKEDMIENEIGIMRAMKHPNIVKLYEEHETTENIFLVMEYVKGGDLFDIITRSVKLTEYEASLIIRDIASSLAHLHKYNIVHRDLKPENVMVQRLSAEPTDFVVKLGDFGLAMEVNDPIFSVCGTPTYVAPEILAETGYGLEVDMWALGVISYILMSGYPPFRSLDRNQEVLFDMIQQGDYDFPEQYWNGVSKEAKEFIGCMLVVDHTSRYTAQQVLNHPWLVLYSTTGSLKDYPNFEREAKSFLKSFKGNKNS